MRWFSKKKDKNIKANQSSLYQQIYIKNKFVGKLNITYPVFDKNQQDNFAVNKQYLRHISTLFAFILAFQIAYVCYSQNYYVGALNITLASDRIVWSDKRYIQLSGLGLAFVMDLNSDFDRFRNYVYQSQSNVSLDGMFRARGRTYPKTISPICSFVNNFSNIQLESQFVVEDKNTYFIIKHANLSIGILDQNCELHIQSFDQKLQISAKQQLIKLGDNFLGAKINQLIYVINIELMSITQKLDLTPCNPSLTEQYEIIYCMDSKNQSWQLIFSTATRLCVYERSSATGNFNFLKQIRLDFPEIPGLALINSTVGFIMTKNCTLIKIQYSNLKLSSTYQAGLLKNQIAGFDEYTSNLDSENVGFIITKSGEVYALRYAMSLYTTIPLESGTSILKASSTCQASTDTIIYYYILSDWKFKRYTYSDGTVIMDSVKFFNFTTLDSLYVSNLGICLVAGGVIDGKLVVSYINANHLISTYYSSLPDSKEKYFATDMQISYIENRYYLHFYAILKNLQNDLLTCYAYRINNSTNSIQFVGFHPMNATYFQFSRTQYGGFIYWHEVIEGKNYILRINSTLNVVSYQVGEDFNSFNAGDQLFRILRNSGRSDLYQKEPLPIRRYGSIYTGFQEEEFSIIMVGKSRYLYIESNLSSNVFQVDESNIFISRTIAQRPTSLCTDTITAPILSSPTQRYTTFITTTTNGSLHEFTVYLTYYDSSKSLYDDKIYTVRLRYNQTLNFLIKSNKYCKQTNTLYLQLMPSNNKDKVMLAILRLDYMKSLRDYMIWDWIYQFQVEDFENYRFSPETVVVYGKQGKKITKFNPGGISPTLPSIIGTQLPYLVASKAIIGLYLVNNYRNTLAVDLITGKQLYTFNNASFLSISPNGQYLIQRNKSDPSSLTIYKQLSILGKIYLKEPLKINPYIFFMSDSFILFVSQRDASLNIYTHLYTYRISENPFIYQMFSFQLADQINGPIFDYNQTHIAFYSGKFIILFDRELKFEQKLSTSLIGHQPDSISLAEDGTIYAKFSNHVHIWKTGQCEEGKENQDGVCVDNDSSDIDFIVIVITCGVAFAVALGVVILCRKLRASKKVGCDPLLQQDCNQSVVTYTQRQSFENQPAQYIISS